MTLVVPTVEISTTGQEETVDGVRIVFQMAPGTEAPSEMLFYFPDHKALCAAEDATHTMHNLLTLRGAVVRDPHAWARYLTETIDLWGGEVEVVFASHHWPTWGNERVVEYLSLQRDLWVLMADLATDAPNRHKLTLGTTLVSEDMVDRLDALLADYETRFEMPREFVVPGASVVGAHLDVARTVVRRAERVAVALAPESTAALAYLNRLSDLLWALARWQDGTSLTARPT